MSVLIALALVLGCLTTATSPTFIVMAHYEGDVSLALLGGMMLVLGAALLLWAGPLI